jgi:hypothetical protein
MFFRKKSIAKGDYFSAVSKAVERLKSSPDNKKALNVLKRRLPIRTGMVAGRD